MPPFKWVACFLNRFHFHSVVKKLLVSYYFSIPKKHIICKNDYKLFLPLRNADFSFDGTLFKETHYDSRIDFLEEKKMFKKLIIVFSIALYPIYFHNLGLLFVAI